MASADPPPTPPPEPPESADPTELRAPETRPPSPEPAESADPTQLPASETPPPEPVEPQPAAQAAPPSPEPAEPLTPAGPPRAAARAETPKPAPPAPPAEAPVPPQRPWLVLSLAIGCLGVIGEYLLAAVVWNARCPADSFVKAGTAGLPMVIIAAAAQFLFWFCLGHYLSGRHSARPPASRRRWMIATVAALIANVCTFPFIALTLSCLSPNAIVTQTDIRTGPRHYAWTDVTTIEEVCAPGAGGPIGWSVQYFLHMKDGALIPLGGGPDAETAGLHFAQVGPALGGHPIPLDTSGVADGCPPAATTATIQPAAPPPPRPAAHHAHVRHSRGCLRVLTDPSQDQC